MRAAIATMSTVTVSTIENIQDLLNFINIYNQKLLFLTISDLDLNNLENIKVLEKALESDKLLKKLDLSYNEISLESAKSLFKILESNTTLTILNLRAVFRNHTNNLLNEAIECLAKALISNKSLKNLDLCGNEISLEGVGHLSEMLKNNISLQEIDGVSLVDPIYNQKINVRLEQNKKLSKYIPEISKLVEPQELISWTKELRAEKVPINKIYNMFYMNPTSFCTWNKAFFEIFGIVKDYQNSLSNGNKAYHKACKEGQKAKPMLPFPLICQEIFSYLTPDDINFENSTDFASEIIDSPINFVLESLGENLDQS